MLMHIYLVTTKIGYETKSYVNTKWYFFISSLIYRNIDLVKILSIINFQKIDVSF